jgi:hypothetical protein
MEFSFSFPVGSEDLSVISRITVNYTLKPTLFNDVTRTTPFPSLALCEVMAELLRHIRAEREREWITANQKKEKVKGRREMRKKEKVKGRRGMRKEKERNEKGESERKKRNEREGERKK